MTASIRRALLPFLRPAPLGSQPDASPDDDMLLRSALYGAATRISIGQDARDLPDTASEEKLLLIFSLHGVPFTALAMKADQTKSAVAVEQTLTE
eukprot:IDg5856t1